MSGAVFNSRFLMRLLSRGKEDLERVSVLKDNRTLHLRMLILPISVTFCDLFDCCIFNYKIMPAVLANTFLFILQGIALADLGNGSKF